MRKIRMATFAAACALLLGACTASTQTAASGTQPDSAPTPATESGAEPAPPVADGNDLSAPAPQQPETMPAPKSDPSRDAAAAPGPVSGKTPTTAVTLDVSCNQDSDCAVKDVGNCCGYYPACVNKDSPTDPKGVQAQCAASGMASVCGFREISACTCQAGKCQAADAGAIGPGMKMKLPVDR